VRLCVYLSGAGPRFTLGSVSNVATGQSMLPLINVP